MSLRDRLRKIGGGAAEGGDDSTMRYDDVPGGGRSGGDVDDFRPRPDGDYHCAERGLYLRFSRPVALETGDGDEPSRGEFTTSGRFVVQRPFGRPVVYTVLGLGAPADAGPAGGAAGDTGAGPAGGPAGGTTAPPADDSGGGEVLVVRRTDTATGVTDRLEFVFEPDRG